MSDAVRQIKERLNIVDVVAPYVELHKAGRHFKGKSPFTNEKTPSFYVSPDRGMYYCFSTSQGGDIFSFIQTIEGVDFKEALKLLAQKANVELVPEAPEKRTERDRLYALLVATTDFFIAQLKHMPAAQMYLKERGVTEATSAKWQIGYAPGPNSGGWRVLKEYLIKSGYSTAEMFKVGVIKSGVDGKEPFDVFRDRIMFPLRDVSGKVVGFSGRTLFPDDKTPKYVNSPETEFYKKSELLFGYDFAKQAIRTLGFSLIVEGQFDVVMSHQAGYTNTVAVSGTALTPHHVQLLERLSPKVVLALDADRAGIAAMRRAADLMLRRGLDVKVAKLPAGADPADLVRSDKAELKKAVGAAVHIIEFLLEHLREQVKDDRAYKLRVREEVVSYIPLIPNRIDQEHFTGVIATALGVTPDAISFEVKRLEESYRERSGNDVALESSRKDDPLRGKISGARGEQKEALLTHLVAAEQILKEPSATIMKKALEEIYAQSFESVGSLVAAEALARASFLIESAIERYTYKSFLEDLAGKLNHLRDLVLKEALMERKYVLRALEQSGSEVGLEAVMAELVEIEKRRKKPPYPNELLTPQKSV